MNAVTVQTAPDDSPLFERLTTVAPNVWLSSQPQFLMQPNGNVTIIEQRDGLVLIDTGGSPGSARRLIAQIQSISSKPVKAIVVTHWHGDHSLGLAEILKVWPNARTIATARTSAYVRTPATMHVPAVLDPTENKKNVDRLGTLAPYFESLAREATELAIRCGWQLSARLAAQYAKDMDGAVTAPIHEGFDRQMILADRDNPVEIRFLGRANTDGDAIAWLPRRRILVTGDTVVSPIPFGFGSFPKDWVHVLRQLDAVRFALLIPGHDKVPKDHSYLRRLIDALRSARAVVKPVVARGGSLDEARRAVATVQRSSDFTRGDLWLERWFKRYWIDPLAESVWHEARSEPSEQKLL